MDRTLAIALLAFDRPGGAGELPPAERAAFDALVAADPALADYARRRAAEDAALSTAMAAVAVPPGAKSRALGRLLARRSAALYRRRVTVASLAASALLGVGLALGVAHSLRPTLDAYRAAYDNERAIEAPELAVRAFLAGRGLPPGLPLDLDYARYLEHGTQPLQGRDVPVVTFVAAPPNTNRLEFVKVYVVTDRQFKPDNVPAAQSSLCTTTVQTDARAPGVTWVLVHTAPLDLFVKPQPRLQ